MNSRRSFFSKLAAFAGIVALAPQLAFRVKNFLFVPAKVESESVYEVCLWEGIHWANPIGENDLSGHGFKKLDIFKNGMAKLEAMSDGLILPPILPDPRVRKPDGWIGNKFPITIFRCCNTT